MSLFLCPKCNNCKFLIDHTGGIEQIQCNSVGCDYARTVSIDDDVSQRPGHPEFHRILEEMGALHAKKGADYGLGADVLANCRSSTEFGIPAWVGVAMRMNDKMIRLKSFAQKGVLANESAEDSLIDIACYAIIATILMREGKK